MSEEIKRRQEEDYKLEKATLEMTSVMHEVKDLAKRFEAQWLQQLNQS